MKWWAISIVIYLVESDSMVFGDLTMGWFLEHQRGQISLMFSVTSFANISDRIYTCGMRLNKQIILWYIMCLTTSYISTSMVMRLFCWSQHAAASACSNWPKYQYFYEHMLVIFQWSRSFIVTSPPALNTWTDWPIYVCKGQGCPQK